QAFALPYDEMRGVGGIHDIDRVDAAAVLLTDALKHPLGPGALDPAGDTRIFRLERARDLLGDRKVDGGVPGELAFLSRGGEPLRRGRGGGRRRRDNAGCTRADGEHRRADEHVAPRKLFAAHRVSSSSFADFTGACCSDGGNQALRPAIGTPLMTGALAPR